MTSIGRTDGQRAGTNAPMESLNNVNTADMTPAIVFFSLTLATRRDLLYTGNVFMSVPLLPAIPTFQRCRKSHSYVKNKNKKKKKRRNLLRQHSDWTTEEWGSIATGGKDLPIFDSVQTGFFPWGRTVAT